MNDTQHLLISLDERHARNIFAGTKRVELRRRVMHVSPGATVWIYVKKPVGCVIGYVMVDDCYKMSPSLLWQRFGSCSGLERVEFFSYFDGVTDGFALGLKDACALPRPISLEALRDASNGFHPPQFFSRVALGGPLLRAMTTMESGPQARNQSRQSHSRAVSDEVYA